MIENSKREREPLRVEIVEEGFWVKAKPYAEMLAVIVAVIGLYLTFREYHLAAQKEDEADTALQQATNALRVATISKDAAFTALTVATNAEAKVLGTVDSVNAAQKQLVELSRGLQTSIIKAEELDATLLVTKKAVSNLLFTVQNRKKELFTVADTNRLIIAENMDGIVAVFVRLSSVPMTGSVDVEIPNSEDRPGAITLISGNVCAITYAKGSFDILKGSLLTIKYYPSFDQSGGGQTITSTANGEVIVGSLRYGKYKRFASP